MREGIGLYKAKRKDTGKWIQGYLFCIWEKAYILWGTTNGIPNMVEVDLETVCEGTGLVDKNGVKIFEGDIVKTDKFGEPNKIYVIEYNLLFGAFIGTDGYGMYFVTFDGDSDQFEVIESIHEKAVEE